MAAERARRIVGSIEAEYRRYESLGDGALGQLDDGQLVAAGPAGTNSVATIVWHVSGNLKSRFTDFLTSDGEKPWRDRESEFEPRHATRAEIESRWKEGWSVLRAALAVLDDADLERTVAIRGVPLAVHDALHRSLAHASFHVGQIVLLAKSMRGASWKSLSIPPGGSAAYNRNPTLEKPPSSPTKA